MNRTVMTKNGNKIELTNSTRFFIPMYPRKYTIFGTKYIDRDDNADWVECYIDFSDERFRVSFNVKEERKNYKIKLTAINETYGSETYYYDDFIGHIEKGYIVVKENEYQHTEYVQFIEPIKNSCAIIVTEGTEIV